MKRWLWFMLLWLGPLSCARGAKLDGYILNPDAFRKIQSYCVDTHNLLPEQVKVIDRFVAQESKPKGLLTKLRWSRRQSCQDKELNAIVRMEFPHDVNSESENKVRSVLFVFRPGSPSPIYETPAVTVEGEPRSHSEGEKDFAADMVADVLEYSALGAVVRILIHDWQEGR